MAHELDEIDHRILQFLQDHGRISNVGLADKIGLSPAPCLRRVHSLERAGVIQKYVTLLHPGAVGLDVTGFVQISLDLQVEGRLEIFQQAINNRPEVVECYLMTGDADFLLRVVVADVEAYEHFLRDFLTRVESVAGIKSSFALKQVKYSTALPLSAVNRGGGPARRTRYERNEKVVASLDTARPTGELRKRRVRRFPT